MLIACLKKGSKQHANSSDEQMNFVLLKLVLTKLIINLLIGLSEKGQERSNLCCSSAYNEYFHAIKVMN